jgi:hypothetical protein
VFTFTEAVFDGGQVKLPLPPPGIMRHGRCGRHKLQCNATDEQPRTDEKPRAKL